MKKRIFVWLTVLALCLTLAPTAPARGAEYRHSGSLEMDKLTREEMAALLLADDLSMAGEPFVTAPSIAAPYAPGEVKESELRRATDRLNVLRRIAGVPAVELSLERSRLCQYGAVLVEQIMEAEGYNKYAHRPPQPRDMPDEFYREALKATGASNLNYGSLFFGESLSATPDRFMADPGEKNASALGHRRWQLNPAMDKVGWGYAAGSSTYTMLGYVWDEGGAGCDYDFIAWPASGWFPADTGAFQTDSCWSVTLDLGKYQLPRAGELTVTLTGEAGTWTFPVGKAKGTLWQGTDGALLSVDSQYFGGNNAIIFRPAGVEKYTGRYTVTIDGLKTKAGKAVKDFTYQVDFFDTADCVGTASGTTPPAAQGPQVGGFADVGAQDWFGPAVAWAVEKGITQGTGADTFSPYDTCSRAEILTFLWRAAGSPKTGEDLALPGLTGEEFYARAARWATEEGYLDGQLEDYSPHVPCTRARTVELLWANAGRPDEGREHPFADVEGAGELAAAVTWALKAGVTKGTNVENTAFGPGDICTRAQIVTFLYRAMGPETLPAE